MFKSFRPADQEGFMGLSVIVLVIACLVMAGLVLGLTAVVIVSGKHGEGVSNARQSWIEGTEREEDGSA